MSAMLLNHRERGSGSAVVLMHGMFGSLGNLGSVARALGENFRTLNVDLRNHGGSPHDPLMDLPSMAADVVATLDSLGVERAALLGHSLGGKVAMQAALSYPERVAKLVVADIAPVRYVQSHSPIIEALGVIEQSEIGDRKEADSILAAYENDLGVRGFLLQNLLRGEDGKYRLRLNLSAIAAHYFQGLMAAPEGDHYDQPTLFIKGENSAYIQSKHRDKIRRLFPRSSVEVIGGTGHWLHAEKPQEFNQLVEQFMRGSDVYGPLVW